MFADLVRRLFEPPDPEMLDGAEARLALAALMVRVARTDGDYSGSERTRIDQALAERFGLPRIAAEALRGEAEVLETEAPDTVRFTRAVKAAVPYEERAGVVEALWGVAAADGINADEHGFLRLVANLLGVADQDSGLARQRVLRGDAP